MNFKAKVVQGVLNSSYEVLGGKGAEIDACMDHIS